MASTEMAQAQPGETERLNPTPQATDESYTDEVVPYFKGATKDNQPEAGEKMGYVELYGTNPHTGLSTAEAKARLVKYGRNELPEEDVNLWLLLFKEFIQPMPIIVWIAIIIESVESIIEYADGESGPGNSDMIDVVCLIFLQFLNVFVGFIEEMKANEAIKALKEGLKPQAFVIRDNGPVEIDASEVVPGDIMTLRIGGSVPADGILCPANSAFGYKGASPIQVDTSQLTGESLPQTVHAKGKVLMGSMVSTGETIAVVHFTGRYTFFGKAADLLQKDEEAQGHFEQILQNLLIVLVVIGIIVNITIFMYLEFLKPPPKFLNVLAFAVVLLIASIPIALRVVCVTTLALGCRALTDEGAIVSKLTAVEELASMTLLCSDKTGTLTQNKMVIQEDADLSDDNGRFLAYRAPDYKGEDGRSKMITFAACAAKWWEPPGDALDTLVLKAAGCHSPKAEGKAAALQRQKQLGAAHEGVGWYAFDESGGFKPFDPRKKRTEARLQICDENQTLVPGVHKGDWFKVTKGAPQVILDMLDSENKALVQEEFRYCVDQLAERGIRSLAIAVSTKQEFTSHIEDHNDGEQNGWTFVGLIAFKDPVRKDTLFTIEKAREYGVKVKMVTGDQMKIARETSRELTLEYEAPHEVLVAKGTLPVYENASALRELAEDSDNKKELGRLYGDICDKAGGFAEVYPEHKYLIVAALQQLDKMQGKPIGMTGDGVNDAPALHRADVGIAVEGSTDAAKAAADIVLTKPGLSTVVVALVISRKIFTRMKNFVVYRVACTEQLLFFFLVACLSYDPQHYFLQPGSAPEFFDLPVIALVTIVILNDGTIISVAFDNVDASKTPDVWNMNVLYLVASMVGGVALLSSLLLLTWMFEASATDIHGVHVPRPNFLVNTGLAHTFKLDVLDYSQIRTMMYLKIALSDYLSLFNCRSQTMFFNSRIPAKQVLGAALFSTMISSILACTWPFGSNMTGAPVLAVVFVWLYVIAWGLVQDTVKACTYLALQHMGWMASLSTIPDQDLTDIMAKGKAINEEETD